MPKLRIPSFENILGGRGDNHRSKSNPDLIVVGLGNPGPKYAQTRHNVGFWCIDALAEKYSVKLDRKHNTTMIGECQIGTHRVILAKPRTYVNRSGDSVNYLLNRYKSRRDNILILYDDINLPIAKLRLRNGGSAGGHNGVKSIIETLGSHDFPRLRIGVGKPREGVDQVEYVIGNLPRSEHKLIAITIDNISDIVESILFEGLDVAMSRFN